MSWRALGDVSGELGGARGFRELIVACGVGGHVAGEGLRVFWVVFVRLWRCWRQQLHDVSVVQAEDRGEIALAHLLPDLPLHVAERVVALQGGKRSNAGLPKTLRGWVRGSNWWLRDLLRPDLLRGLRGPLRGLRWRARWGALRRLRWVGRQDGRRGLASDWDRRKRGGSKAFTDSERVGCRPQLRWGKVGVSHRVRLVRNAAIVHGGKGQAVPRGDAVAILVDLAIGAADPPAKTMAKAASEQARLADCRESATVVVLATDSDLDAVVTLVVRELADGDLLRMEDVADVPVHLV